MSVSLFASSPVSGLFAPRVRVACSLGESSAYHPTQGREELSHNVQYSVLDLLQPNIVIVIGIPAHTSRVVQALEVSIFSSLKSYKQREFHRIGRDKLVLDAIDIAEILNFALSNSFKTSSIVSGFRKCSAWDLSSKSASDSPLIYLFPSDDNAEMPTLPQILGSFRASGRSLLRDADFEENVTIRIRSTGGAHLTSDAFLDALKRREAVHRERQSPKMDDMNENCGKETASEMGRLCALALERSARARILSQTRRVCRQSARMRAVRRAFET